MGLSHPITTVETSFGLNSDGLSCTDYVGHSRSPSPKTQVFYVVIVSALNG